ncbi:hypothetical protein LTS10_008621 [Elasticomyces elasticus]|nr:hypothetical protein LTS10_008621 [Elasticomyces elasticus]
MLDHAQKPTTARFEIGAGGTGGNPSAPGAETTVRHFRPDRYYWILYRHDLTVNDDMHRTDSPSSVKSQDITAVASRPVTAAQKPSYRLFPSVEPTPPASPKSTVFSSNPAFSKSPEPVRRRSSSLDETARTPATTPQHGMRSVFAPRRRPSRAGMSDMKPMSTVQEIPLDSPTVPTRFTFKSFASSAYSEDSGHGRSSSAPLDVARDEHASPTSDKAAKEDLISGQSPVWQNRQAAASTQTLHGLGLTMPPSLTELSTLRAPSAQRSSRPKPNLRLNLKFQKPDRPPPPPPKSPRHAHKSSLHSQNASFHSRSSSAQSRTSSRASSRASSPISTAHSVAYQPIKPIIVHRPASSKGSPASSGAPVAVTIDPGVRARDIMGTPMAERGRQIRAVFRKPMPRPPPKESPGPTRDALSPPASRFSATLPTDDLLTEGERTPRALPFSKPSTLYQNPAASTSSLMVPGSDADDAPPPTPQKDSFKQKRSDESMGRQLTAERYDKSAVVRQISIPATTEAVVAPLNWSSKAVPPARDPPRLPVSMNSANPATDSSVIREEKAQAENTDRSLTPDLHFATKSRRQSRVDKPTPELPFRSATPELALGQVEDPAETMRGLARQTEALHARYTSLRSDRQKLSMSIVSSLRDQQAGPQYGNTLLDQHMSLAAINSSMDICFAKLKSLECRKEAAMAAIITQQASRRRHEKLKQATVARSHSSLRSAESSRSTPEVAVELVSAKTSANKARKDSVQPDLSALALQGHTGNLNVATGQERSQSSDKHPTAKRPSTGKAGAIEYDDFSSSDVEAVLPRKIRIKGAKAAKLLGLIADEVQPGSPGITLPAHGERELTPKMLAPSYANSPAIEVHIPSSPFHLSLPPPSPAPTSPLPTPPAGTPPLSAPLSRKGSMESAPSVADSTTSVTNTVTMDVPEGNAFRQAINNKVSNEVLVESPSIGDAARRGSAAGSALSTATQDEREEEPMGLKSARRGLLQTIQVFVDDEILDYYHNGGRSEHSAGSPVAGQ